MSCAEEGVIMYVNHIVYINESMNDSTNQLQYFFTYKYSTYRLLRDTTERHKRSSSHAMYFARFFLIDLLLLSLGYMTMGYSEIFDTKSSYLKEAKSGKLTTRTILESLQMRIDPFTGCIL